MLQGLADLRVLDFSDTIAGSYTTKLLADAGAGVIKVEPPGGDPLRRWPGPDAAPAAGDSPLFRFLNTGKQSILAVHDDRLEDDRVQALLPGADLVVNTFAPAAFDAAALRTRYPHLVVLSITPWGRSGPYSERAATEFILQAESGSLSGRGLPEQPPVMAGGRITEWVGGTFAAVAALAACRRARASGCGDHIDFSLLEVMTIAGTSYADLMASLAGRPPADGPQRTVELPSIEPTRDGWVGFTTNSRQQFADFLVLIGRTDLADQPDLADVHGRTRRMDEWNDIVRSWTATRTTEEIVEAAALLRIPVAPVNNGKSVLEHAHFRARGVFVENPGGGFLQPRPPYLIDGESPSQLRPPPAVGEHDDAVAPRPAPESGSKRAQGLPLQGIRVLDATAWWAGPSATQMLGHLGAEVIHLEAIQRLDGMRMLGGRHRDRPAWWEYSGMFLGANTNKLGLTLNLDHPDGLATVRDLIARCDVFVENCSPRVMEKFGLDWAGVHSLSPTTILVRMPAFGLSGPWKHHVGFAQTMEQITGLAWITGYPEDQPRIQRGPCDPLAGMNAAFATLVALAERERTGVGSFVECPMVEGALNAAAEQIVQYSARGVLQERAGNRCATAAPQGLYACRGHRPECEQWLALSVEDDAQWRALLRCLDSPAGLTAERFAASAGRHRHHDEIDALLGRAFAQRELGEMLTHLVRARVPAGEVVSGAQTSLHPQLMARDFYEQLDHPVVGRHPHVSAPFRSEHTHRWLRAPAPVVGQHNSTILRTVLGYSEQRIAELERLGVTGTRPAGV